MSVRLKSLIENKGKMRAEIRRMAEIINAEGRDFTSEEQAGWDKVNTDYDANEREIAKRGGDRKQVWEQLAREEAERKRLGLEINLTGTGQAAAQPAPAPDPQS